MAYSDQTIHDRNVVKRWIQRRRFRDAVATLANVDCDRGIRIIDFGAGDGELARRIAELGAIEVWAYEPTPDLVLQAKQRLAGYKNVVVTDSLENTEAGTFDYVFCLEVFEHLPEQETSRALAEINRLLKPTGSAVIGVPHEIFLPALAKGLFRMFRRYGKFDASPRNILCATLGRPPLNRPAAEIAPGLAFHFDHLGFDYRAFERRLQEQFEIRKKWFSPIPLFGSVLNSEVYFSLTKAERAVLGDRR